MKVLTATFAIVVDRTALAKAAAPAVPSAIRLFNLFPFDGRVVLTRPRLTALFDCTGKKDRPTERARGRSQSSSLGPLALDVVGPSSERSRAYVTSIR